jgi:Flp pilus assembly pilin Flp
MTRSLGKWLAEERGGDFAEYVVLVAVVALLSIFAFAIFGHDSSTVVNRQGADVAQMGL